LENNHKLTLTGQLVTEALLLQDLVCGTVCLLVCDRWQAMDCFGIWEITAHSV